ncbi:MAG: hypothetical protein ACE15B_16705 [Bryobacteraceae bacterium]
MDIDLNTLKREILEYLETSDFAVFHSRAGGLHDEPLVLWNTEQYPDYRMFLATAKKAGIQLVLFASREFLPGDIEEMMERIEACDMERDERRDLESRLRELRAYQGETCALELAFDNHQRLYVYEVRPDWYDDFLEIEDEIMAHEENGEIDDEPLGGYFSRN